MNILSLFCWVFEMYFKIIPQYKIFWHKLSVGYMYFLIIILKDETSPFKKNKKNLFLKLKHLDFAIGGVLYLEILRRCILTS